MKTWYNMRKVLTSRMAFYLVSRAVSALVINKIINICTLLKLFFCLVVITKYMHTMSLFYSARYIFTVDIVFNDLF